MCFPLKFSRKNFFDHFIVCFTIDPILSYMCAFPFFFLSFLAYILVITQQQSFYKLSLNLNYNFKHFLCIISFSLLVPIQVSLSMMHSYRENQWKNSWIFIHKFLERVNWGSNLKLINIYPLIHLTLAKRTRAHRCRIKVDKLWLACGIYMTLSLCALQAFSIFYILSLACASNRLSCILTIQNEVSVRCTLAPKIKMYSVINFLSLRWYFYYIFSNLIIDRIIHVKFGIPLHFFLILFFIKLVKARFFYMSDMWWSININSTRCNGVLNFD